MSSPERRGRFYVTHNASRSKHHGIVQLTSRLRLHRMDHRPVDADAQFVLNGARFTGVSYPLTVITCR